MGLRYKHFSFIYQWYLTNFISITISVERQPWNWRIKVYLELSPLVFVPQVRNKYLESLFNRILWYVDKLWQSLDFSGKISPNEIQPKMMLNVVENPKCSLTFIFITTWSVSLGWETYWFGSRSTLNMFMMPYHDWFVVSWW